MIVVGIDPGITGGLAFVSHMDIKVHDIPSVNGEINATEVDRLLLYHCGNVDGSIEAGTIAVIERASSRPGQGVASTFKYGAAYGALKAIVACAGIPLHVVTPQSWKKHFKLDSDKEKSRALAIRLWPSCPSFSRKMDHGRAEAALIAQYGREVLAGRGM